MAAFAVIPISSATPLYVIEEQLQQLADAAAAVQPEQEAEFLEILESLLSARGEKLDRIGRLLATLENRAKFAGEEIKRLQEAKRSTVSALEKLEGYIVRLIEKSGPDRKGKYPKLEGNTVTFSLKGCPPSVEVTDDFAVPPQYKRITITMPLTAWEEILDALDVEFRAQISELAKLGDATVDKPAVKAAIEAGAEVPGADLVIGKHNLVRR